MNKVNSYIKLQNNQYLVTYYPSLDYDIINNLGLDIVKIASKYRDNESSFHDSTSVCI